MGINLQFDITTHFLTPSPGDFTMLPQVTVVKFVQESFPFVPADSSAQPPWKILRLQS